MSSKFYIWYQWCLGLFLNCIDYYVTKCYTIKMGIEGEFNPIMYRVIEKFGINSLLYCKLSLFLIVGILFLLLAKQYYSRIGNALAVANVCTGSVVGWGIYCLLSI
jgi:hypothetical protein